MQPSIADEPKVLGGGDRKERVVVGRECEGISVEGKCLECVRHPGMITVSEYKSLGRRRGDPERLSGQGSHVQAAPSRPQIDGPH